MGRKPGPRKKEEKGEDGEIEKRKRWHPTKN